MEKCDVWSIGVLIFIIFTGKPPFYGKTYLDICNKIQKGDFAFDNNYKGSDLSKDFIESCLVKNPDLRPSSKQLMSHKWFQEIDKNIHSKNKFDKSILLNLQNFSEPIRLKRIVMKMSVHMLSSLELNELANVFKAIDLNNKGLISPEELSRAFQKSKIKMSDEEIQEVIKNVDFQKNGMIDYNEFVVAASNKEMIFDKDRVIEAFGYFDVEKSGLISASDLEEAMLRSGKQILNHEELDDILEEVSKDEKKVSLDMFLQLFGY